jgi:hypothetical protein
MVCSTAKIHHSIVPDTKHMDLQYIFSHTAIRSGDLSW